MPESELLTKTLKRHRTYVLLNMGWYALYVGFLTLVFLAGLPQLAGQLDANAISQIGWLLKGVAVFGILMFMFNLYLLTPQYDIKWWTLAFVNIGFGVSTCILAPYCIILGQQWNADEIKAAFNVPTRNDPASH